VAEYARAGLPVPDRIAEPVGCAICQHTGYKGRAPLIEVLEVDAALRDIIREGRAESVVNPTPPVETLLGHGLARSSPGRCGAHDAGGSAPGSSGRLTDMPPEPQRWADGQFPIRSLPPVYYAIGAPAKAGNTEMFAFGGMRVRNGVKGEA